MESMGLLKTGDNELIEGFLELWSEIKKALAL